MANNVSLKEQKEHNTQVHSLLVIQERTQWT
jgi:hypothetical protein